MPIKTQNRDYFKSVISEMQPNHRNKFPEDIDNLSGNLVWSTLSGDLELRREFFSLLLYKFISQVTARRIFDTQLGRFIEDATQMTGAVVEEYHIDKLDSVKVNLRNGSELLKLNPLEVRSTYHTINRPLEKYSYTLSPLRMKKAVLNEGGLESFIADAARTLENSYTKDNMDYVLRVIGDYIQVCETNNRLFQKHCDFDPTQPTNVIEEQAKKIAAEARTLYKNFQIDMTRTYNPMGVMNFANDSEILVFIRPELEAYMSVFVEALAYNMGKTGFTGEVIVVPNFGANANPDTLAVVTTTEFFRCWKTIERYSTFFDPDLQTDKYYLHVEGIFSSSLFENFAIITKGAGTELPFLSITNFGAMAQNGSGVIPFGNILTSDATYDLAVFWNSANLKSPDDFGFKLEWEMHSYQGEIADDNVASLTWTEVPGTENIRGSLKVNGNGYITMTIRSIYNPQVYRTIRYELRTVCVIDTDDPIVVLNSPSESDLTSVSILWVGTEYTVDVKNYTGDFDVRYAANSMPDMASVDLDSAISQSVTNNKVFTVLTDNMAITVSVILDNGVVLFGSYIAGTPVEGN